VEGGADAGDGSHDDTLGGDHDLDELSRLLPEAGFHRGDQLVLERGELGVEHLVRDQIAPPTWRAG